jgi:lipopolysaccharide/colanic/teichoic acid biosynthesis glycosyltransferase
LIDICGDSRDRLHFVDFTGAPEDFMAAADVLCLPSYREGCGVVTLEGAAAGLPILASRIYGLVDSVEEGRTGMLHEAGDAAGLAHCLRLMIADPELRRSMGAAGRAKAIRDYSPSAVTAELLDFYAQEERRAISPDGRAQAAHGWYRRFGKRLFDVSVVLALLPVVLPLCALVALAVRTFLGAPVLFRQQRPGQHGVPFRLVKFRTMTQTSEAGLEDERRLTAFGRWLRSCSLDELPELWNVLRGDMSLVGPRPLLMSYLDRYTAEQARRHDVRPGITGLAQVNGRNALGWDDRFAFDREYIAHCSLGLDVRILALTLREVIARRGVSQPGHATSGEFMGTVGR